MSPEQRWSASSWLFEWVVRSIAQRTNEEQLATKLFEIVDENLGWLDLSELTGEERTAVIDSIAALPDVAQSELSTSLPGRQAAIDHIGSLAAIVRDAG